MYNLIKKFFRLLQIEILSTSTFQSNKNDLSKTIERLNDSQFYVYRILNSFRSYPQLKCWGTELDFLLSLDQETVFSKSQLFQDLFVLYFLKYKRKGFFVEFGATDGVSLSNTWLLEKKYEWDGVLCEPGKKWQTSLLKNRNCRIDFRCVWSSSSQSVNFIETTVPELSTIGEYVGSDFQSTNRIATDSYIVETVSLNDLLLFHKAPINIDYLSLDTEGSEFEILKTFDFNRYNVSIITVEHNFTSNRQMIFDLLQEKGFKRVFENLSQFDDWYIKESILNFESIA